MSVVNFSNEPQVIGGGVEDIVIKRGLDYVTGGKALNVETYLTNATSTALKAGHIIIKDTVNGDYKPMPLADGGAGYGSLPDNHVYVGVLANSITTSKPAASILTAGTVNVNALPFSISSIASAFASAVPTIIFE